MLRALKRRRHDGPPARRATVDDMLPRPWFFSVGRGDFRAIGEGILRELQQTCGLAPHHHVLDVGCGTGRVAIPMTQYLSSEGRYEGFDPVAKAIRHCQERINPSYPNFRFQVADLYSKRYNPRGRYRDHDYRFPYDNSAFDVVFAVSVFTHLLPPGAERYVAEAARVLKPGGRFFATWFLLNDASVAALDARRSTVQFPHRFEHHRTYSRRKPEAAVAYDEEFVADLYPRYGLGLTEPPAWGTWIGAQRGEYGGFQDRLVASKQGALIRAPARRGRQPAP